MRSPWIGLVALAALSAPARAQSYTSPAPTGIPAQATTTLSEADRATACTQAADRRDLRGLRRAQYQAACRGLRIPTRM